jgi:hypothetical protein
LFFHGKQKSAVGGVDAFRVPEESMNYRDRG